LRTQFSGQAAVIPLHAPTISEALEKLPFALTGKQKIVLFQILKDMELPYPMARLLQGDVGTGKTLVVFLAMLHISAQTGMQSAFLVPTEILAQQHVQSFFQLFPDSLMRVELLT
jgi:ATP-dependent DNA helicase RecG